MLGFPRKYLHNSWCKSETLQKTFRSHFIISRVTDGLRMFNKTFRHSKDKRFRRSKSISAPTMLSLMENRIPRKNDDSLLWPHHCYSDMSRQLKAFVIRSTLDRSRFIYIGQWDHWHTRNARRNCDIVKAALEGCQWDISSFALSWPTVEIINNPIKTYWPTFRVKLDDKTQVRTTKRLSEILPFPIGVVFSRIWAAFGRATVAFGFTIHFAWHFPGFLIN